MPKGHYVKLASHSMVGIVLIAYVKTSLRDRVTNVMFSSLPTGMMGKAALAAPVHVTPSYPAPAHVSQRCGYDRHSGQHIHTHTHIIIIIMIIFIIIMFD